MVVDVLVAFKKGFGAGESCCSVLQPCVVIVKEEKRKRGDRESVRVCVCDVVTLVLLWLFWSTFLPV